MNFFDNREIAVYEDELQDFIWHRLTAPHIIVLLFIRMKSSQNRTSVMLAQEREVRIHETTVTFNFLQAISTRLRMSKSKVHSLTCDLERHGYITLDWDSFLRETNEEGYDFFRAQRNFSTAKYLANIPYENYLETPEWQQKKRKALEYADFRCQICNSSNSDLHVHHRTYERRGNELDSDLTVLCNPCHDMFHRESHIQ